VGAGQVERSAHKIDAIKPGFEGLDPHDGEFQDLGTIEPADLKDLSMSFF